MSDINEIGILTCPLCGSNSCIIFYGFSLVYPNFDNPKQLYIELKYICTQNNNKMSSIQLSSYLEMINLNSKFNSNFEIEPNNNINIKDINEKEINENIRKISDSINDIIINLKQIITSNKDIIIYYINENKGCLESIKYFLSRYIELNDELYSFISIFIKNIKDFKEDNLKISFLYISRLIDYFEIIKDKKLFLTKDLIEDFVNSNEILKLPFLMKLNKVYAPSKGREILRGHNLPIVGLAQMRNGLLLSGSFGLLKIWQKNSDINSENYSCFEIFYTVNYVSNLIQSFIELEDNIIAFIKGKQIIEAMIDKNSQIKFQELFQYQAVENSLESLTSINNNNNLVAGLYQKIYVYKRNNPLPIYTLQYHEFFIEQLISIPYLDLFCSSGTDHKVILYKSENFEFYHVFEFDESHIICLCNYNTTDFCASTMRGKIWYFKWNEKNKYHDKIGPINAHQSEIYGISQIKNGNVVSVSRDSSIKIWDINKLICNLKIVVGANDHIIQLKDGRLCCASHNLTITIFNDLLKIKDYNFFSLES